MRLSSSASFQMLVFGGGPLYFPDGVDWRPDCVKYSDVLLEDGASSRIERVEGLVLLKDYVPSELYKKIRDKAAAEAIGWDVGEVEWGIIKASFPAARPRMRG